MTGTFILSYKRNDILLASPRMKQVGSYKIQSKLLNITDKN